MGAAPSGDGTAVARHDALLRTCVAAHQGHVFKTVGDAVCAVFADPTQALAAALASQRALAAESWGVVAPLRVRMALHAGAVEARNGDYFGPPPTGSPASSPPATAVRSSSPARFAT